MTGYVAYTPSGGHYCLLAGSLGILAKAEALRVCRGGTYQRDLLNGRESWAGIHPRGKEYRYGSRHPRWIHFDRSYAASREGLIKHLERSQIPHHFIHDPNRGQILILGLW